LGLKDIGLHAIWRELQLLHYHHLHGLLLSSEFHGIYSLHIIFAEYMVNNVFLLLQLCRQHLISEARVTLHHLLLLNIGIVVIAIVHIILSGLSIIDVLIHERLMMRSTFPLVIIDALLMIR